MKLPSSVQQKGLLSESCMIFENYLTFRLYTECRHHLRISFIYHTHNNGVMEVTIMSLKRSPYV
jgi:hypothetical protein